MVMVRLDRMLQAVLVAKVRQERTQSAAMVRHERIDAISGYGEL